MAEITIDGVTLQFSESAFTAAQWEQVASWVLNGGGEAAAENAQIALKMASEAAKSEANADEDANSAKSYAVGGTGTREGEDTDNAKFYCQQAHAIAGEGMVFSVNGVQADDVGNVNITKDNIGLDKVNNTADTEKPVSLAQQQALDALNAQKAALLHAAQHKTGGSDPLTPEDIGAGRVNPNILHNWYFANPVNQRGKTEYSGATQYTIDRWKATNAATVVFVADGYITLDASAGAAYLRQFFENALPNQAVTISAMVRGAGQLSHYLTNASGTSGVSTIRRSTVESDEWEVFSATYTADEFTAEIRGATFAVTQGGKIDFRAVKLEYGTQQTLAHQDADGNWVLNEIPDYGEQLALCQRYCQVMNIGKSFGFSGFLTSSATTARGFLPIKPMRAEPAISATGKMYVNTDSGSGMSGTDVSNLVIASYYNIGANSICVDVKKVDGTTIIGTNNAPCVIGVNSGSVITLSADL